MSLQSVASANANPAFVVELLPPGVLNHITAFVDVVTADTGLCLIDVGLATVPFNLGTRFLSLISGHVARDAPLSWTGLVDILSDTYLYLMVEGDRNSVVRITTHRIVPAANPQFPKAFNV